MNPPFSWKGSIIKFARFKDLSHAFLKVKASKAYREWGHVNGCSQSTRSHAYSLCCFQ